MPNPKKIVLIGEKFGFITIIENNIYRTYGIKNPQKTQYL